MGKVDFDTIKRYLDGNEQKGDREKIISWFSGYEENEDLHRQYNRYWLGLPDVLQVDGYDEEKMLGKIYHKIKLEELQFREKLRKRNVVQKAISIITKVAAVLFIPMTIFVLMNWDRFLSAEDQTTFSEIHAPKGTHTKFNLPDGSTGYLNGGSTVWFPTVYRGKSREVTLEGEAYFNVRSNPKKPFVVSGTNIKVVARGTSFNVEAYPEDNINKITLVKGSVEIIGNKEDQVQDFGFLTPGSMCVFNKEKFSYRFMHVDADKIVSWKDGKLVFINEPFDEVVKKLNRRYGVNIVIKDEKLKDYTYLATFVEDETLDEILKLLKLSAPIEVVDRGRKIGPDGSYKERTIEFYFKTQNR